MSATLLLENEPEAPYLHDPVSWNLSWEAQAPHDVPADAIVTSSYYSESEEAILVVYRECFRRLCDLQREFAMRIKAATFLGFPTSWQAATPTKRREVMLEGHVRTSIYARGDAERRHCTDVTLDGLEREGGLGFLELLGRYFPEGGSESSIPRSFPRAGMAFVPEAEPATNAMRALLVVCRDEYLCKHFYPLVRTRCPYYGSIPSGSFVFFTTQAFYNAPRPNPTIQAKAPVRGNIFPEIRQVARDVHGDAAAKEMSKQVRAHYDKGVRCCETCREIESLVEPEPSSLDGEPDPPLMPLNPPFKQCKPCGVLGRRVYYCSRLVKSIHCARHTDIYFWFAGNARRTIGAVINRSVGRS